MEQGKLKTRTVALVRRAAWLLIALALSLLLWYWLDFAYVSTDNETDYAIPSDVVIVLGCPSYEGNVLSVPFTPTISNMPSKV